MNVIKDGEMYKASRITGPKHNYLGIVISASAPEKVDIVRRNLNDENVECQVDESRLVAAVNAGVQEGNQAQGTTLCFDTIEFVPSDTPDYKAYTQLAKAITIAASNG